MGPTVVFTNTTPPSLAKVCREGHDDLALPARACADLAGEGEVLLPRGGEVLGGGALAAPRNLAAVENASVRLAHVVELVRQLVQLRRLVVTVATCKDIAEILVGGRKTMPECFL